MTKNLNLGNFLTILQSNIFKLQIFLKNRFHSNWRSYLVLTSGQKPKKSLEPFLRKVSDFELIWRLFREYRQIKNFFQNSNMLLFYLYSPLTLGKKNKKILKAVSEKTALLTNQPTNQPTLIWRPFGEYLQIKCFFQIRLWLFYLYSTLTSCKKSEKSLEPFLGKLHYQPTSQPTNQLLPTTPIL